MKQRKRAGATPAAGSQAEPEPGHLSGIRPIAHDDDADRPSREDVSRGGSPFRIPVPLPGFFCPKSTRRPRG
jgi:hypothetical protein